MSPQIVEDVPLEKLFTSPQARRHFDEASLHELAQSIRTTGMLQPILARLEEERLLVVEGERRFLAAKRVPLASVPVIIQRESSAAAGVLQIQLVANMQRADFRPLEKAQGIAQLMKEAGWSATEVAKNLGLSVATVTRSLSLLKLPESIRARIESEAIPASAGYELTHIEDPARQAELAEEITAGRMTRDSVSGAAKAARKNRRRTGSGTASRATAALGDGRSVSVLGQSLTLESVIRTIEDLLLMARKARTQGLSLPTFLKVLRETKA
jgi:ParB family transcriptional regulator, chromosome partitioning protein